MPKIQLTNEAKAVLDSYGQKLFGRPPRGGTQLDDMWEIEVSPETVIMLDCLRLEGESISSAIVRVQKVMDAFDAANSRRH